jgi:hypothetical protein
MGCSLDTAPRFCSALYHHLNQQATTWAREQDLLQSLRSVDGILSEETATVSCYICLCRGRRVFSAYALQGVPRIVKFDALCGLLDQANRVFLERPPMMRDNNDDNSFRTRESAVIRCCSECNQRLLTQFCAERLHCLSKLPLPRDVCLSVLFFVWRLLTNTTLELETLYSVEYSVESKSSDGDGDLFRSLGLY